MYIADAKRLTHAGALKMITTAIEKAREAGIVRGSDAIEWCNGPPLLALAIAHPDACPGEVGCMRGDDVLLPAASS